MDERTTAGVLLGYDGSLPAGAAIEVAARLLPDTQGQVTYIWTPPFASEALRRRLWHGVGGVNEFVVAIEREGEAEARRIAAMGVALAAAHGWKAQPLIRRSYGAEGLQLDEVAEETGADLIVVGSRGLGGAQAVLSSVSDMVVHYARSPVLVVPHPLLEAERAVLDIGPVVVGWDGSPAAEFALAAVTRLFPGRAVLPVFADGGEEPAGPTPPGLVRLRRDGGRLESGRANAAALADHARTEDAAVIAVGSRGRSALREILLGSSAMATLHHAHRPVLVVPFRAPR
ncbi:universal stress protein [Actinoplanes xinjiangensis]|uniref:Nucleotide-binding universal stress UspA family protein n=1 Tax=Actinoplanes xinjiangensis TaxID=512350 RepID=A0A316EB62_9ACTN|nr:universal stress protein [Actinoplanes xinjiangensis]PWK26806.1 nucleotide-binding universal stress UspA family protein [Actinoplanes xinjiangensis]GIF45369.1 universal stress protein [Actinoplanes xinjiangensis]